MIHVIATIQVADGRRNDFLAEFHRIIPDVREEVGCIDYGPSVDLATNLDAQDLPRENVVVIIERWESLDHLEQHLVAPHMLAYRERVKELVRNVSLQILEPA